MLNRNIRQGLLESVDQGLQVPLVGLQAAELLPLVLQFPGQTGDDLLAPVLGKPHRCKLGLLLFVQACQLLFFVQDLALGGGQALHMPSNRLHLLCAHPVEVIVVDHHPADRRRVLLIEQDLEPLLAAHGIGRAHLTPQFVPLLFERLVLNDLFCSQLLQVFALARKAAVQYPQPARQATDLLFRFLQLTRKLVLLAALRLHLCAQLADPRTQCLEFAALLLRILRRRDSNRRQQHEMEQQAQEQAHGRGQDQSAEYLRQQVSAAARIAEGSARPTLRQRRHRPPATATARSSLPAG